MNRIDDAQEKIGAAIQLSREYGYELQERRDIFRPLLEAIAILEELKVEQAQTEKEYIDNIIRNLSTPPETKGVPCVNPNCHNEFVAAIPGRVLACAVCKWSQVPVSKGADDEAEHDEAMAVRNRKKLRDEILRLWSVVFPNRPYPYGVFSASNLAEIIKAVEQGADDA